LVKIQALDLWKTECKRDTGHTEMSLGLIPMAKENLQIAAMLYNLMSFHMIVSFYYWSSRPEGVNSRWTETYWQNCVHA